MRGRLHRVGLLDSVTPGAHLPTVLDEFVRVDDGQLRAGSPVSVGASCPQPARSAVGVVQTPGSGGRFRPIHLTSRSVHGPDVPYRGDVVRRVAVYG